MVDMQGVASRGIAGPRPRRLHDLGGALRGWRERLATPVVRNALYLMATEAVGALLGLGFWAVAGRMFSDVDLGLGAVLITSGTSLAILSTLGFNISLVRFLPEQSANAVRLINSSVTIASAVAVALAIVVGVAAGAFLPSLGFLTSNPALLALFALFTAVWTISLLFDAAFIGLGKAKYVLLRAVIYNLLKIPLPALVVSVVSAPFALFSGWGFGLLIANAVAAVFLFRRVIPVYRLRPDLDRDVVGPMVRYSVANHATNVIAAVPGLAFPLLVAAALGAQNAAYFYIAWVLANLLFIIPGSIFTSVFAEGSRWRPGLRGNAADGLFLSFAVLVPGVAAIVVAGPAILGAVKSTFVVPAAPLLNLLAASSFFVAINALYIAYLRVEKRMRPLIGIFAGTTFGAIALAWPLSQPTVLGLPGVGLAVAIAQGAGAAYALFAMLREGVLRRSP